ncbi:MAG: hypothetical protein NZ957_04140 [Thaumarchaeota archaeon]|nr:hypothetical protein [Candidatus Calditenuaceae archaeon]MDW8041849.1 hypothetical protein [Nitrososphaerota archaeon]
MREVTEGEVDVMGPDGLLFRTQEVGSLSRAPFLKGGNTEERATQARYWGKVLDVENYDELVRLIRNGIDQAKLLRWASLYGIRFHEAAGLDVVWDGEQRRVEMYEHSVRNVENFVFTGRVKVWDAETYNKAKLVSAPRLRSSAYIEEFLFAKSKARRELKVPVTGPYTIMDWSFDEFFVKRYSHLEDPGERRRRSRLDFLYSLIENVMKPELRALVEAGATRIQVDEPALTTKPDEVRDYVEAFNEMVKGLNATWTLHVCYSDYSLLLPHLTEMRIHELSIECANRDTVELGVEERSRRGYSILKTFSEQGVAFKVAPGVIDVHTDFIEPPELVRDRLLYSARLMGDPTKVIACNDCGLRTRRWEVAFEKERSLVKGAELARRALT